MKYEIGAKIRYFRELRGLSQKELANMIGVSNSRVSNWEQGINRPDADILALICTALNVSADELLTIKLSEPNTNKNADIFSIPGVLPLPRTVKIPLLGTIACGEPILAVENLDGYIDAPEDIHGDFALRCKGDSMIGARIHDGDVVYIRQQPDVENNEIAAVLIDESDVTLKRIYKKGGQLILMAENPTFEPIIVNGEHTARILGKAVGFTSLIK